jgi:hypothetical protein
MDHDEFLITINTAEAEAVSKYLDSVLLENSTTLPLIFLPSSQPLEGPQALAAFKRANVSKPSTSPKGP